MKNNYICALDLGSSKINCALAKIKKDGLIAELFLESLPCEGMRKGGLIDFQEVSGTIERILKRMKEKSRMKINFVYLNVYGEDVSLRHSYATIPLAERGNKLITISDIRKVKDEARILGSSLEEEIVQTIPFNYTVDNREIINPLGLYGHKLGVNLLLILVKTSYLEAVERVFNRLGYEIKHLFLSLLSTSKIALNQEQLKKGNYVLCDIAGDLTEIAVFENSILSHIATLNIGGMSLTKEIAEAFKFPLELAEELKISCAYIDQDGQLKEDKEVMIKKDGYYKPISQNKIRQVLALKAKDICRLIKEKIDTIVPENKAINCVFFSGRTLLLAGFLEMMETTLEIPVKPAVNSELPFFFQRESRPSLSAAQFLNYSTVLGVLYEAMSLERERNSPTSAKNLIARPFGRIKEIYEEYF